MNSFKNFLSKSCVLIATFISINAHSAQPSQAQIEQFKNLPKAQQQSLAKQFGVDISAIQGASNTSQVETPAIISSAQPRPETLEEEMLSDEDAFLLKNSPKELKPFGYEIFANAPSTFNPVANIAIPSDYIIGVGDNVSLQVFGKESAEYQLAVTPEGNIFVPELGQFKVVGLSFSELKRFLVEKVKERIIGVDAIVSLSELKSIRVFVLGDAYKPGAYTLSSLASISHALFSAGGVNDIGSLRNIQLKRAGKLVKNFDLYDLLIEGDASNDVLLQSGDVVFIAPKGNMVSVTGEVRRPAIYEALPDNTIDDVINMAGGLLANAHKELITIERIKNSFRTAINLDLTSKKAKQEVMYDGDVIKVASKSQLYRDSITLIGAVTRPGKYEWQEGDKVSDVFQNIHSSLLPDADLLYSLVIKEIDNARNIEVHQFSIAKALANMQSEDNLLLGASDKVIVFSLDENLADKSLNENLADKSLNENLIEKSVSESQLKKEVFTLEELAYTQKHLLQKLQQNAKNKYQEEQFWNKYGKNEQQYIGFSRERLLAPILQQLKRQSASGQPLQLVDIAGQVKFPGTYPLTQNNKISELITAAGGVKESAYLERIDITRNILMNAETAIVQTYEASQKNIQLNLAKALNNDSTNNITLQSKDRLYVHQIPAWSENKTVELKGEFVFPGTYTIQRGDTLNDVITRAGGFTHYAAIDGSVFTREKLKALELENINKLTNDLRLEFASKALTEDGVVNYTDSQQLIRDLAQLSPIGRLVIDLNTFVDNKESNQYDLLLEEGDVLFVPSLTNSINVIGQVQVTSSHLYNSDKTVFDYINQSGGIKTRADEDRIYVIAANGSIKVIKQDKSWFSSNQNSILKPGDTIVVPLDANYISNLDLWSSATQIIYNSAVALAAIGGI